ncbi:hypothetical protein XELAEV_18042359mg, partial [Xenopus laevis]
VCFLYSYAPGARKHITRKWLSPQRPTIGGWITLVNQALPYRAVTYKNRGCPDKYKRIWNPWFNIVNQLENQFLPYAIKDAVQFNLSEHGWGINAWSWICGKATKAQA